MTRVSAQPLFVPLDDRATRDQWAGLAAWLIHAPGHHPFWSYYYLCVVHLRDMEGQSRPAYKQFPGASHEILLLALNPAYEPITPAHFTDPHSPRTPEQGSIYLEPANIILQLPSATDAQAIEVARTLLHHWQTGQIPLEPEGIRYGEDNARTWIERIALLRLHNLQKEDPT